MKKILLTAASFITIGLGAIYAQGSQPGESPLQASFKEHLKTAKEITWTETKNYKEATFTIDNRQLSVFFTDDGRPFAASRNITTDQLPLALAGEIKRRYNDYWITDLFEISKEGHSEYYITLENADRKKLMKSDDYGQWVSYNLENVKM